MDERYLARLECGQATNPGRDVAVRVCKALVDYSSVITRDDVEKLLKLGGYPPSPDWLWELPAGEFGIFESKAFAYWRS